MSTETLVGDKAKSTFAQTLVSFAKEPDFKDKGPAVFFYQASPDEEAMASTFGEPPPTSVFYEMAVGALGEASGRAIFRKSMKDGVPFVSLRCGGNSEQILMFFGWNWDDAHAFLVIFATQMGFDMPAALRLTTEARNRLPPSTRALLFA